MKQVRIESAGKISGAFLHRGKWYDVVGYNIVHNNNCGIHDDTNNFIVISLVNCPYLAGGAWEMREKPKENKRRQARIKPGKIIEVYNISYHRIYNKWYDVHTGASGSYIWDEKECRMYINKDDWEIRDVGAEGYVTHSISESDLKAMYKDICDEEWKDRIRKAIPTFKPENKWEDITKDYGFSRNYSMVGGVSIGNKGAPIHNPYNFILPNKLEWGTVHHEYKVENCRLWRRLK